ASIATAQVRGQRNSMSRVGMRGALTPRSIARMPMHRAPMPGAMGRMPMYRARMSNSALGRRRFNRFNDGDFNRDNQFRRFKHFNEIIFIGDFASPWWWGPCSSPTKDPTTMETLIEIISFVASSISTKSFLSATSLLHGGGVLGGAGTGTTTHTNPTDILSIRI